MKRFLILFLLVANVPAFAQKIHFSDKTNHWVYSFSGYDLCEGKKFVRYGIDTMMFGRAYQPMVDSYYTDPHTIASGCIPKGAKGDGLFIREDTTAGFVYGIWPEHDTVEKVLFNYNLRVGDSVHNLNDSSWSKYVDSVYYIDSTPIGAYFYKTFFLKSTYLLGSTPRDMWFIEGLGAVGHILKPIFADGFEYSERLICFSHQYANPTYNVADFTTGSTPSDTLRSSVGCIALNISDLQLNPSVIKLSPNPAYSDITISSPELINEIIITNITGQVVCRVSHKNISTSISVNNLPSGMYIVELRSGNNDEKRSFRRFIKE